LHTRKHILLTDQVIKIGFDHFVERLNMKPCDHKTDTFALVLIVKTFKSVHSCRIDQRHVPESQDPYHGFLMNLPFSLFKAIGGSKEKRAIDLVNLHPRRK